MYSGVLCSANSRCSTSVFPVPPGLFAKMLRLRDVDALETGDHGESALVWEIPLLPGTCQGM